jgi:hypothetical protein
LGEGLALVQFFEHWLMRYQSFHSQFYVWILWLAQFQKQAVFKKYSVKACIYEHGLQILIDTDALFT